jgi:general secretion pathway protein J
MVSLDHNNATERLAPDTGLTLVEALVALFVFSLVSAGCVLMLMQSVTSQKIVAENHTRLRELQIARSLFLSDMAQIVPRNVRRPDGTPAPVFVSNEASGDLAFVRAAGDLDPEKAVSTSLAFVEYVARDGALIRRSRTHLDATPQTPSSERTLFAQAENVRFEFFDGAEWRAGWFAAAGRDLPPAAAIIVTLPRYGEVRLEAFTGAGS